jgi:mannosyltransferase
MDSRPAIQQGEPAERGAAWRGFVEDRYLPGGFLLALAIATRFLLLGHQSLWYDEVVSLTLAKQPFGAMLHDLARTESTPPLYYVLLWVWVRLFGTSAVALRSLSACLGVLTVGVVYLAARLRFSPSAALVAGALAATNPMLIWYSQETRAYALATCFVACSLYFMLRAPRGGGAALAGWSIAASLALASHYFAVFAVVPEAVYLIYIFRHRLRPVILALLGPVAVEAALLPLAIYQRDSGHTAYIAAVSLRSRIAGALNWFLLGPYGTSALHTLGLCLVVALGLTVSIGCWGSGSTRRNALLLTGLAVATFVLPLLITPGSVRDKNMIVVLPPLLLVAGAAFSAMPTPSLVPIAGLAVSAVLLTPTVLAARRLDMQREDWRGMATLIGPPSTSTGRRPSITWAVLTYPRFEYVALRHYRPDLKPVTRGKLHLRELDVVGRDQLDSLRLPPGFRRVGGIRLGNLRMLRFRAHPVQTVSVARLHLVPLLRLLRQYHGYGLGNFAGQNATLLIERKP